jgi:PKD repeat protein
MRFLFFCFFLAGVQFQAMSQVVRCYTTEMQQHLRDQGQLNESDEQFEQWLADRMQHLTLPETGPMVLPVVVHIIYRAENNVWNISDAQVHSQIDILNQDFLRLNPDTSNTPAAFGPVAVNSNISFCLAQRDPQGNPTTGIIRHQFPNTTAWSTNAFNSTVKPATIWDPTRYFNIWVANLSGSVLGYAQFPTGSGLPGLSGGTNANTDGIVLLYSSVGRPPFNPFPGPYNLGRTATHEVGHYLGLRHIWGDGGCSVDDFCDDTPRAAAANYNCPNVNTCDDTQFSPFPPVNLPDMVQNYMDYTTDACMNLFTANQRARMLTVMANSPRRASLLTSDACLAAIIRPQAAFAMSADSICAGGSVSFSDLSANQPSTWQWTFTGGVPSTDTTANPSGISFANPGTYNIQLIVSNSSGADTLIRVLQVQSTLQPTLAGLPTVCANDTFMVLQQGLPRGGIYAGPGILSDSLFNPALAGPGTHRIYYSLPGCGGIDSADITVQPIPAVSFSSNTTVLCINDSIQFLTATPPGGSFTGPGVVSNIFNPLVAGAGQHAVVYTVSNSNGCVATDTVLFTVNAVPIVSVPNYPAVCATNQFLVLSGAQPAGGTWSGPGVSNDTLFFFSGGQRVVRYTSPANNFGCTASATTTVQVNDPPQLSFTPTPPICINTLSLLLNQANIPSGNYSGPGVSFGVFFPGQAGAGTHTIQFSGTSGGCNVNGSFQLTVFEPAEAVIEPAGPDSIRSSALADAYLWYLDGVIQPQLGDRSIRPQQSGLYSLQLVNNSCQSPRSPDYAYFMTSTNDLPSGKIRVYPNPTQDRFKFERPANSHGPYRLLVTDLRGRQVFETEAQAAVLELNLHSLEAGTYLLLYQPMEGSSQQQRVVKY